MDKNMENQMETGIIEGYIGVIFWAILGDMEWMNSEAVLQLVVWEHALLSRADAGRSFHPICCNYPKPLFLNRV